MKRLPKTLHIRTFYAVAIEKSISQASDRLAIGKATVSRHISELEIDLGINLFRRLNSGMELTDAGTELLSIAEKLALIAVDFSVKADSFEEKLVGVVKLSVSPGFAVFLLPNILSKLRVKAPSLQIVVHSSMDPANMLMGEADISLRSVEPGQASLRREQLPDLDYGVYASLEYLERYGEPATPKDLEQHQLIGQVQMLTFKDQIERTGFSFEHAFFALRTDDVGAAWNLILAGCGIGVSMCKNGDLEDRVRRIFPELPALKLPLWISSQKETQLNFSTQFVYDFIKSELS